MRILITNDDGIHSPGLDALERIARTLTQDVWVVAPETDQSGVAHSLTLSDPLRLRHVEGQRFALRGTPTDCVIMGVRQILPEAPDLVLSGINRGQNIAEDVTYSGTVAGAMEGSILGIRSIAVSQAYSWGPGAEPDYGTAEAHAPALIKKLLDVAMPKHTLLNINFPPCSAAEVAGVSVTAQGFHEQSGLFTERRMDGRGNPYYWLAFKNRTHGSAPDSDLQAIAENRISVTPLHLDMTAHALREELGSALESD